VHPDPGTQSGGSAGQPGVGRSGHSRRRQLADHLIEQGIEKVTVEATSDYWRIWFYLLEAAGLDVQLVNAREVKKVPGRPKTDLDAVWLAKLTEKGMLRPSFVPPLPVRQLRDYTRLRIDLTRERTRHWQRLEKRLAAQWSVFSCRRQARFRVAGLDLLVHLDRRFGPIWAYGF